MIWFLSFVIAAVIVIGLGFLIAFVSSDGRAGTVFFILLLIAVITVIVHKIIAPMWIGG